VIPRSVYVLALGVAVGALELAAAYGGGLQRGVTVLLGVVLGAVVYRQGEEASTTGRPVANVIGAFGVSFALSLAVGTALLVGIQSFPVDLALWRTLLEMINPWLGLGAAFLSAYFLWGVLETFVP